jgi:predicted dehydrogenase
LAGGEWSHVFADLRQVASAGDTEDHVKIVFRGRDRVVVDVEIGVGVFNNLPRWRILGKYGSLYGDGERLDWKYYDPAALPEPMVAEGPAAGRKYGSGETLPWITESAEPTADDTTQDFYARLYASVREGAPLLVPPAEIRHLVALFDACREQSA